MAYQRLALKTAPIVEPWRNETLWTGEIVFKYSYHRALTTTTTVMQPTKNNIDWIIPKIHSEKVLYLPS